MTLLLRCCYSLLMYLLLVPACGYFYWRSRKEPAYRQRMAERFAWQKVPEQAMGGLIVHAVSVGEVVAATPLIKALQQQYPTLRLTISCTTPTASERIRQSFADSVYQCYLPLDTPGNIKRWLNKLQPQAVIILETELWPNLLQQCRRALIPTIVVNARLSAKSARGYRRWYGFSRLALDNISLLLAQNTATVRRFKALGCQAQYQVTGNLKFDMTLPATLHSQVEQLQPQLANRQIWVAGSTHDGEDAQLLAAYQQLKPQFPQLLLILVPRHPQRFNAVAELISQSGLVLTRRSDYSEITADTDVLLGDSMGELLIWYQLADLVFIGGSLIRRGGHNPLEAMVFAKAIQTGPHVFNFAQAYQWLAQDNAVNWVSDVSSLVNSTAQLLTQHTLAAAQGQAAQALYQRHGGASKRICQAIAEYLGTDCGQFTVREEGPNISWYQADVFAHGDELSFNPAVWQQQQAVIGQSQGRNIAWFIKHRHSRFVLRHYYRGGLIGKILSDKFSLEPLLQSRAMAEYALLRHMRRSNLPVPRPLAAQYCKHRFSYQSDLIIELIDDSQDLATLLSAGQTLTALQWQQLGQLIARFHQQGIYHSDLNCHNILLDKHHKFWLIDFDKCAVKAPGAWQQANLQRLLRSLHKERKQQARFAWQPEQWPAVLQGYQQQFADRN